MYIKITPHMPISSNLQFVVYGWSILRHNFKNHRISTNAETWLACSFRACISFHDNISLSAMLKNTKTNLIHGSNDLFRLYLGKTLNTYHVLLILKALFK